MRMELEARPSVREWRGARRRIDKLERSLVAARDGRLTRGGLRPTQHVHTMTPFSQ